MGCLTFFFVYIFYILMVIFQLGIMAVMVVILW